MKRLVSIGTSILAILASSAYAQTCTNSLNSGLTGVYISLAGGYTNYALDYQKRPAGSWQLTYSSVNISSYTISPAIGYDFYSAFNFPVRLELAANYYGKATWNKSLIYQINAPNNENISSTDSIKAADLMANLYFDYHNVTPFTPFIGLGVGMADLTTRHTTYGTAYSPTSYPPFPSANNTQHHLAWNAIAGVNYQASEHISLLTEATYADLGRAQFNTPSSVDYKAKTVNTYNFLVGARYTF